MQFIDTHSHLYDEAFCQDQDEAVARAADAGVTKIILPDIDSKSRGDMFAIADRHPENLFPCIGLHPTSVDASWKEEFEKLQDYSSKKVWAVGEIGIDCYWSKEYLSEQIEAFTLQLEMAHRQNLPVIIHSREATGLILEILGKNRHLELRGVFHAFSGSLESFQQLQSLGDWYIGIGGVLTFKKASIAETVRNIPLERIVLETDAPYLTPVPFRGQRNESAYIPHIAARLSELKQLNISEVAEQTTLNAKTLFGI